MNLFGARTTNATPINPAIALAAGGLLALLCLWGAARAARRGRLISDLPTCSTAGVFIGLVELKGTAESESPLRSYLAEAPCVHYAWSVEEHWERTVTETYTDKDGKTQTRTRTESGWTTVASGGETQVFYLRDADGVIRVHPDGAKLEPQSVFSQTCTSWDPLYYAKGPPGSIPHSTGRRMFSESAIPLHAAIYVVGSARERDDVVAPEIVCQRDAPLFLISTRTEAQVRRGYTASYWVLGILGLILWIASAVVRDAWREVPPQTQIDSYALYGGGYIAAWILAWIWTTYNSLVELRQRVHQACANVDVQLKRRADLIPNLVRVVEGLRDYERTVQAELATLRSQLGATAPGQPGPDPRGCATQLLGIVEKYPELRANQAFLKLQQGLAETEQRIALARGYFNAIATFHNNRLEVVPDRFVAGLAGLRPQPLIVATDFERAAVAVKLAD